MYVVCCVQALVTATQAVQSSLETEQQRLATLLQKLNAPDVSCNLPLSFSSPHLPLLPQLGSEAVSEEWLQSLRERQKVSSKNNLHLGRPKKFFDCVKKIFFHFLSLRSCWSRDGREGPSDRSWANGGVQPPRIG